MRMDSELLFNQCCFSLGVEVVDMDNSDDFTAVGMCRMPLNCIPNVLKMVNLMCIFCHNKRNC